MSDNVLDKYRVIAQLGRGGMSDVYLAATQGPGGFAKLLAIKVLPEALARDGRFLAMFREEARLAARLNHPNVVQTYEVGESQGKHFIAMEYLEGQALHRVMERFGSRGGITASMSLRIVIEALAGLQYAHELVDFDGRPLGIVHRDITPQNVFVTYEGQVKLVDFGIAKAVESSIETMVGTVKGKVAYMAPEQARGELVDRRADIFSMGVVLWELLSGRRLWEGLTDIAVIGRLVQGDIPHLSKIRPDLGPGLARACMRALSPDPRERHQSASELQRDLEIQLEQITGSISSRRVGELMREVFLEERAQVRTVIRKQLELLARTTPSGVTPPGGWKLALGAPGDMPILGEGSAVHEAVTALHTGQTNAAFLAPQEPVRVGTNLTQLGTGATATHVAPPSRGLIGITVAAVAITGIVVGWARPWEQLSSEKPPAPELSREATGSAQVGAAAPLEGTVGKGCDAPNKPLVELTGEITGDARLTCDKQYLLRFTTTVTSGATLTIEPGTTLLGDTETKGILLVQPGGRIHAEGREDSPIVFTSDRPIGQRKAGDWGGVIILGLAPTNLRDAQGNPTAGKVEGLSSGGEYGGTNPDDSSGVLRFVRIEYSGTEIAPNNEVNGLTLAGVGRGTVIDHVQVRHTADDCFEFFGGTVDARYLICQHPDDDAFDWDYGYTGRLQFLISQSAPGIQEGSHGFEGDNDPRGSQNEPISAPTIYNVTLCGKNRVMESKEHYGMLLRRGTRGRIRNALVVGFSAGLDVQDGATRINIAASTFYNNLVYNLAYPENSTATRSERLLYDDDNSFDEQLYLSNPGLRISEADPQIGNCSDPRTPRFKPRESLTQNAAEPPDDGFFDTKARYVGAFRDSSDRWDEGAWVRWID